MRGQALSRLIRKNASHAVTKVLWKRLVKCRFSPAMTMVVRHLEKNTNRSVAIIELSQFFEKGFSDSLVNRFNFVMIRENLPVRLLAIETGRRSEIPWQTRHVRLFVLPPEILPQIYQTPH